MRLANIAVFALVTSLLWATRVEACACNGKDVRCRPECVQICTADGTQAEVCGEEAGKLLLSIGKETPTWKQIQAAAGLFNHPEPSAVFLRDFPGGSITRVPLSLLRPFAGITISLREATALDGLSALASVAGVKLEIAGRLEGSFAMAVHDASLTEIMDNLCESKGCAWSLVYSEEGWTLRVAGEVGSHHDQ